MKKILTVVGWAIFAAACNSNAPVITSDSAKMNHDTVVMARDIQSPYPIGYSSKFAMGNAKYAENVLTLWKDYDNGTLSAHKDFFADSMTAYLGNGGMMHASRDSVIAGIQRHRNMMSAAVDRVDAVMAVKSTDKNEDWVLIWGTEVDTHKNGKVDSVDLQETWRINKDGKADMILQYVRPYPTAKK